jgi:1-acyl-sn-glycerol-3-phosphate acyltransferase
MRALRASLRLLGLTALTLVLLVPALAVIVLAWPLAPLSAAADRAALRALLGLQTLWSRGVLAVLGVRLEVVGAVGGAPPRATLLVSNHLSYLDVPVIAALGPCRFVAKSEVAGWPVFGFLARCARVLFIERRRPRDLLAVGESIAASLAAGVTVVVFPESTSTRGDTVLPFHAGLLEPAARIGVPCRALAVHYETSEESRAPSGTICWWGDMTLPDHLWSLMTIPRIDARLTLSPRTLSGPDRKQLAAALHAEVAALFRPVRQSADPDEWAQAQSRAQEAALP